MSIPDELKQEDQEIKRPPIVGEWFVVSPTKISRTKMKLLKALGFIVVDMTDWYAAPNGKMGSAPKSQIERMVASSISGNYQFKLASFDVTSLFTNISLDFTIEVILKKVYREKKIKTKLKK